MKISPTYANRADLTRFDKWKFTLEERIEQSPRVRRFYRWCFFLPEWVKFLFFFVLLIASIIPLFLAFMVEGLIWKMFGRNFEDVKNGGVLGTTLLVPFFGAIFWIHPLAGTLLVLDTFALSVAIWFFGGVMEKYHIQLLTEGRRGR